MRTSMKIAAWTGIPAFFIHWARNIWMPSQEQINQMSEFQIQSLNEIYEPVTFLLSILYLIALPAFVFGIYKNIVEAKQSVVTNIHGDKIKAEGGSVVTTRGANARNINTGTNVQDNNFAGAILAESLDTIFNAIKNSDLEPSSKMQARGLVEEIKDAKKNDKTPVALIGELLEITKKIGPATQSVSEAVKALSKFCV